MKQSPYLTGFAIGLLLLTTFLIMGRGPGATGGMMMTVIAVEKIVSTEHLNETWREGRLIRES